MDTSSVLPPQQHQGSVQPTDSYGAAQSVPETEPTDHTAQAQPQYAPEPPQVNWDSHENPYRTRLQKIQGSLQQQIEARRAAEHHAQQLEYQQVRQSTQHLPPQQQQQVFDQWQQQQQVRQQQQQVQEYEAQLQEREDAMERVATQYVMSRLSQQYGVPMRELQRFRDPDSMEYHAQVRAQDRRQQTRSARQRAGNDRFEGGATGGARYSEQPKSFDESKKRFIEMAQQLRG